MLRASRKTIRRASLALAAVFALSTPTVAQTWVGDFFGVWNQPLNWSPNVIPNSPTAAVTFTGNDFLPINIQTSVQSQSLTFAHPTASYTITSNGGVGLSSVKEITVATGVTGTQTINLGNGAAPGSLSFPTGSDLTITNNSTAAGTTLVIGSTTVIGTLGFGGVVVDGPGTTSISGGMSAPTPNRIVGGLTKNGSGTLILSNPANNYLGDTYVHDGTLMLGHGMAIPTGSNVTVFGDGVFNTAGLNNGGQLCSSNAIGTLSLSAASTFRVPTGTGDYWLNKLEMTGGTVDFTGTSNFWLHFTGAGTGITINSIAARPRGSAAVSPASRTTPPPRSSRRFR